DFTEAEKAAREKAARMIETQIHEALEENVSTDIDPKEWNWQALAGRVNNRYGLKTTDRELKKIGRDNLAAYLGDLAEKSLASVDLTGGKDYLKEDWGLRSICDWVRLKFEIKLTPESMTDKKPEEIKGLIRARVMELYRQKEIEFPIKVAMARFMSDKSQPSALGQRYDREGLFRWCSERFENLSEVISEEDFRTQSRAKLHEQLQE